jgi:hypothetical protein
MHAHAFLMFDEPTNQSSIQRIHRERKETSLLEGSSMR